jgi:hypothetical protein
MTTTTSTATDALPAIPDDPNLKTVDLDDPIKRGEQTISSLRIRKPRAGELRGVTLIALSQIDVSALQTVLPRICDPMLTAREIGSMDPADIMSVGATVASFFFTKADKAAYQIS